ncbi:MAG: Maf family protein [Synergistaceae bacterium]|jgi:septum formation protein|nr:Maf family protein [Synergistaceae bacterium]
MNGRLILASDSPRRREILLSLECAFDTVSPNVDESPICGETPIEMAVRLACAKALSVSKENPGRVTLGADTVVDVDGSAFGKPLDRDDSLRMLRILNGRTHLVHTGVALAVSDLLLERGVETTSVTFGSLTDEDIVEFAMSGGGDDKAGAYAIQGKGALLIERIDGCYYNVVGLPVFRLRRMLERHMPDLLSVNGGGLRYANNMGG